MRVPANEHSLTKQMHLLVMKQITEQQIMDEKEFVLAENKETTQSTTSKIHSIGSNLGMCNKV